MKKLTLCITLVALSFIPALQAGESGCCPASKAAANGTCPMKQQVEAKGEKAGCCAKAAVQAKAKAKVDTSAKGASQLVKK